MPHPQIYIFFPEGEMQCLKQETKLSKVMVT